MDQQPHTRIAGEGRDITLPTDHQGKARVVTYYLFFLASRTWLLTRVRAWWGQDIMLVELSEIQLRLRREKENSLPQNPGRDLPDPIRFPSRKYNFITL